MVQMKDVVVLIVLSCVLCFDYGFIFAVIVQGKRGIPALDADTFVFLEGQKLIGQIFETFGPVPAPLYSIRFNSVRKQCFVYLHQRKTNGIFLCGDLWYYSDKRLKSCSCRRRCTVMASHR